MGIIINGQNDTIGPVDNSMSLLGNVSIGGTMTIEDFTNIDSVGLITARNGLQVTGGNVGIGENSPVVALHISRPLPIIRLQDSDNNDSTAVQRVEGVHSGGTTQWFVGQNSTSDTELWIQNVTNDDIRFGTNNTERLRIKSNGEIRQQNSGGSTIYELKRTDSNTTGSVGTINFTASDGHSVASMSAMGDGDNEGAHIVFRTTSAAANNSPYNAATAERLRIRAEGPHLLVGTGGDATYNEITESSSNAGLVIGSSSMGNGGIVIRNSTSGTGRIYFADNSGSDPGRQRGQINYYHNGDYMMFATAGSERLRIESNGYIKTNSEFWIGGGAPVLRWRNGGTEYATARISSNDLYFEVAGTEKLRITSGGDVGIGTNSPSTKLDVRPTAENPTTGSPAAGAFSQIRADDATVGKGPSLALMNLSGSKETGWRLSALTSSGNNGDFTIHGYGGGATYSERLRITADGKIGINASSGWNFGDVLLVQANTGATAKSMITVRGGSAGYVHSAIKLSATTSNNSSGNYRGLGVFMHDEASSVEWYAGRPYAQSDYFLIARNTAVNAANAGGVTAQHNRKLWRVDSSGRTVQNGGIYTYQPGQTSGAKSSRAFEAKGASGTYSTCVIELDQHSYGSVAWDIKVGGYHSAHQHVAGTYYCNGALYANYTSINNSANVSYTRVWVSGQMVRHTFNYNNGFVHPVCEVTATCGGDGYFNPGDITITWS